MQTIKKIKVARTDKTTRGASLRSHVRLDKINNLSFSFRFVFDEALQLKKAPIVEPSIESSEQSLSRFCAFALQPSTQVMKFSNLGFRSFEKNTFACYSEVVYSDINTQNPVATRSWSVDFSGKCDVKREGKNVFVEGDRTRFYNGLDFELETFNFMVAAVFIN